MDWEERARETLEPGPFDYIPGGAGPEATMRANAEAAGYGAIVVTLDTLILGWRPRDIRTAYLPFISGQGCAQFFTDPVFRSRLDAPPEEDVLTAAIRMLGTFPNLALTWDDLAWL